MTQQRQHEITQRRRISSTCLFLFFRLYLAHRTQQERNKDGMPGSKGRNTRIPHKHTPRTQNTHIHRHVHTRAHVHTNRHTHIHSGAAESKGNTTGEGVRRTRRFSNTTGHEATHHVRGFFLPVHATNP